MIKNIITTVLVSTIFFGCKSDSEESTPSTGTSGGIAIEYEGYVSNDGDENGEFAVEGSFNISSNGEFILEDMAGSMIGSANKENATIYEVSISDSKGGFEHFSALNGSYDSDSKELILNGKDVNNNNVSFDVQGIPLEDHDQQWKDNRSMSAVYFTHNSNCDATITIDNQGWGEGPINAHWQDGGYCDPMYDVWRSSTQDYDDKSTDVFCATGTLIGIDGNPVDYEDCFAARFVLDKKTDYSYTVDWINGTQTTGSFTTPDGGEKKTICLSNSGPNCLCHRGGGIGIISHSITIDGTPKVYDTCDAGAGNVILIGGDHSGEIILIENGPFSNGLVEDFMQSPPVVTHDVYLLEKLPHVQIPPDPIDTRFYKGLDQGDFKITNFTTFQDGTVNSMTITFNNVIVSNSSQSIIHTINGHLTLGRL